MTAAELGVLLLCCRMGRTEVPPLTLTRYRALRSLVLQAGRKEGVVTVQALLEMGCSEEEATTVTALLGRGEQLRQLLNTCAEHGITPVTRISPGYPRALIAKLGDSAPPCLFVKGDPEVLNTSCVGLAGSRDLLEPGRQFARAVGQLCAKTRKTLVAGCARGADREAEEACLQAGGRVLSFVADGLYRYREDAPFHTYCSEDGPAEVFSAGRAHSRNRLIHCMGDNTMIAQASLGTGGTWAGTVQNLKNHYSRVYICDDGSEAAEELSQLGAQKITAEKLQTLML